VLTDAAIKAAKPVAGKQVDLGDARSAGLFLRITEDSKVWSLRYTDMSTGKRQRISLGGYPDVSLSDARKRAEDLRRSIAAGQNPLEEKRRARAEAGKRTFAFLANRYMAEHARRFKRTAAADDRNLRLHVLPAWGRRTYASISRSDVIDLIEGLVAAGKEPLANRVQMLVSRIFSFAIDAALLTSSPTTRLRRRGREVVRSRTLTDAELRLFWAAIGKPPVSPGVGIALRLALVLGLRAGEIAGIARSELVDLDDPDRAGILIPASRVKSGKPHWVPLPPLAQSLVREALALAGAGATHLFPSRGPTGVLKPAGLSQAMFRFARELPADTGILASASWRQDPPTPHDLRRTAATRLSSLGIQREDRLAVLGHSEGDVHKRHYDQYARAREKRLALNAWAGALEQILAGEKVGADIIPLRRPT
jgi:integrase